MKRPALSIIIPTYNSAKLIIRCLKSLETQTANKSSFEIIIVNDGSNDDTREVLQSFLEKTDLSMYVLNVSHCGPAIARNQGVLHAQADWIAFLDADIIASSTWIETGLSMICQHPEIGGFEGRTQACEPENITPFTHQTINLHGGRYPTCNMILKKSLCFFYPEYKIPFREDTDLAFSIQEAGYEIMFVPQLLAYHPPLPPRYLRPIQLAKRYYYDALLEKRFPKRYKEDVDVHYIMGMRIPHLRKKIYTAFILSQVASIGMLLSGVTPAAIINMCIFFHLSTYMVVMLTHLQNTDISFLSRKDFTILAGVTYLVPWVMIVQRWRGHLAFKKAVLLPSKVVPTPTPTPEPMQAESSKVIHLYPAEEKKQREPLSHLQQISINSINFIKDVR